MECLSEDLASSSRLSIANKAIHRVLLPCLYAKIALYDTKYITMFCKTMDSAPQSKCNKLVKVVWVEAYLDRSYITEDLLITVKICVILKFLTNLQILIFIPTSDMFADGFIL
jgi:hypothetical protein